MARIRSIKPEFPQSESVGSLSRDARLLFVQLWTIVDDAGRSRAASRMLASLLYPYDDDAAALMEGWLSELERNGIVHRYVVDGSSYLEIVNWLKHQKIDHPSASKFPSFSPNLANPREPSRTLAPDRIGPRIGPRTKKVSRTVANATRPDNDQKFDEIKKAYPKRQGGNPSKPARALFEKKLKEGADPEQMIAAIRAGVGFDAEQAGTKFIPRLSTWLSEERYRDTAAVEGVVMSDQEREEIFSKLRENANDKSGEGTTLQQVSSGACEGEGKGRQEPARSPNDKAGNGGMVGLGKVLSGSFGVRPRDDDALQDGDEPGDDSPRAAAGGF